MNNRSTTSRKTGKILLFSPPRTIFEEKEKKRSVPPLGLIYLAAALRQRGYRVKVVDAIIEGFHQEEHVSEGRMRYGLNGLQIGKIIESYNPDVVGVSSLLSAQHSNAESIFSIARQVNPDIITVTGGAHPSAVPGETLKFKDLDYVILGEGELSFPLLLDTLKNGRDPGEVDGLAYRNGSDVVITQKKHFIKNLDDLPMPARDLLPMKKYAEIPLNCMKKQPFTYLITSRGCPFRCSFCASRKILWGNYRWHSPGRVLTELQDLYDDGYEEIQFFDDNLTANKERAKTIFRGMIEKKWDFSWATPNGISVKGLDTEMMDLMKESGCYKLILAVESGNQYVLNNIAKKPINLKKVPSIVSRLKKRGIEVEVLFMIGFPNETRAQIMDTVNFAKSLDADYVCFYIVTPLPGTEVWDIAKQQGYLISEDIDRYNYCRGNIRTPEFTPEFLEKIRYEAWKEINFGN